MPSHPGVERIVRAPKLAAVTRGTVWGAIEKVRRCGKLRKRSKLCGSCTNSRVASGMAELPRGNRPQVYPRREGFTVSTGPATASIGPRAGQCGNRRNPAKRQPFRYRQIRSEHIDDAVLGEAGLGDWPEALDCARDRCVLLQREAASSVILYCHSIIVGCVCPRDAAQLCFAEQETLSPRSTSGFICRKRASNSIP